MGDDEVDFTQVQTRCDARPTTCRTKDELSMREEDWQAASRHPFTLEALRHKKGGQDVHERRLPAWRDGF